MLISRLADMLFAFPGLLLAILIRLPLHSLSFPKDFIEIPDLGKIQISKCATESPIGPEVVRPSKPGHQFVRSNPKLLKRKDKMQRCFGLADNRCSRLDELRFPPANGVTNPV